MLKKYPLFHLGFFTVFAIQVIAVLADLRPLISATKPLICMLMMAGLYGETKLKGRFHKRIFSGLFLALVGDLFLLCNDSGANYFSYGLAAFFLSHICYIRAFYLDFSSAPELDKKGARLAILLCATCSVSFYLFIRSHLGAMKLPVLAYLIVISVLVMMAAFRRFRVNNISFNLILIGAVIFTLSDALLSLDKFVIPFKGAECCILATYMLAQYLITLGAIERRLLLKD
ncbi:hypothetical protein PBAL39_02312 [Pedobacter sp. BAL39]|uniref:lysoplasmalogenase n=1 Tax=Pedobacter sp. BAL39 TaxID=391596 RepID=UPI0001559FBE|nr:lysoplasmalogenase [Pedobacter sp. BAL39]EDM38411.1 hypothetical protein PBAL39_02312 [Pedobacter sp. BAL39]